MQSMSHYQKKSNSFVNINSKKYSPHQNSPHAELLKSSQPIQFHSLLQKDKKLNGLSFVSPSSSELNKFKEKLAKYLQERQTISLNSLKNSMQSQIVNKSEEFRNQDDDKTGGFTQGFSKSQKSSSNSLSRRKNIKQCIKQWSSSKQKKKSTEKRMKTLENEDQIDQISDYNNPSSLIVVKKIDKQKEKFILAKNVQLQCDFYNTKEVPIHHTQLFFFRKHKKVRTEHSHRPIDQPSVEMQPKVGVSMQELLQIRKSVRHNIVEDQKPEPQKKIQASVKSEQVLVEEQIKDQKLMVIHQQELQVRKGKSANQLVKNRPHFGVTKKRHSLNSVEGEAIEISPWQRRNTTDLSLLF